jgi:hypothetical protein
VRGGGAAAVVVGRLVVRRSNDDVLGRHRLHNRRRWRAERERAVDGASACGGGGDGAVVVLLVGPLVDLLVGQREEEGEGGGGSHACPERSGCWSRMVSQKRGHRARIREAKRKGGVFSTRVYGRARRIYRIRFTMQRLIWLASSENSVVVHGPIISNADAFSLNTRLH